MSSRYTQAIAALEQADASARLSAALALGSSPEPAPELLDALLERCAMESDFFVREMLTWALLRLPREMTVPRLVVELRSEHTQARSQALHTLSKIKDAGAWPAITRALLHDADDEVARCAWRAAVVLVPDGEKTELAAELAAQLGRGDRQLQLSLSRALLALGKEAIAQALEQSLASDDALVQAHARATERLLHDPSAVFDLALYEAKRHLTQIPDKKAR
jgi:hypothetical protein